MPLFGSRNDPPSSGSNVPGDQAHAVAPGDLSERAQQRLHELRGVDGRQALFTSDLSVDEFILIKKSGFDPLGLVIGSSIYHVGLQSAGWRDNQELTVLSQAMYTARELAVSRMEQEAEALAADGVIGVRLIVNRYEWGPALAEFMAMGTAVRHRDGQSHRTRQGKPFTSDLSGQDFHKLLAVGYQPTGLVMGSCVYHVAHQGLGQALRTIGNNVEMSNYTQALYDARELAMERMQREAEELGAEGIVGVRINEASHGWGSHVIEFFSIGTAVTPRSAEHPLPEIGFTLPLTN